MSTIFPVTKRGTPCCVSRCNNFGGHQFPGDANAKNAWVLAIRRGTEKPSQWVPTKSAVVCSDHFMKAAYSTVTYHGKLLLIHQILQPLLVGKVSMYTICLLATSSRAIVSTCRVQLPLQASRFNNLHLLTQ